jgi:hypothetical protein
MKLYLKDEKLSPVLSFMSKKKLFSDILIDLYKGLDIDIRLISSEGVCLNKKIVLNSNYYLQPQICDIWSKRLAKGKLNIGIFDGANRIGYYNCSPHAEYRAYDVSQVTGIEIIDYQFVQNLYKNFRSRVTNNVKIKNNVVVKESANFAKIQNEFTFLASMQNDLNFYIPVFDLQVFDKKASYKMPLITPGDISSYFLNNQTTYFTENKFELFCINYFKSTMSLLKKNTLTPDGEDETKFDFKETLRSRMYERSKNFISHVQSSSAADLNLERHIIELLNTLTDTFETFFKAGQFDFVSSSPLGKFHGDFCLSNILFDKNSNSYFLVDPRGDEISPICLDLAKLSHSLNGNYDSILAGRYHINLTKNGLILNIDDNIFFAGLFENILEELNLHSKTQIRLLESFLFLTMIIFHKDDLERCLAFLLRSRDILLSLPLTENLELSDYT